MRYQTCEGRRAADSLTDAVCVTGVCDSATADVQRPTATLDRKLGAAVPEETAAERGFYANRFILRAKTDLLALYSMTVIKKHTQKMTLGH